ncbi:MAG: metal ABC transporter permease [Clostridiales bacterium]|nr:metal ABC transporter permease [Clostridiales bacterium]
MDVIYAVMDAVLPLEALQFSFMKNAFLAILLLTPLLGLLGTMAVNKQMAFFSDALGHSALTGIGLGIVLGVSSDLVSMIVFGVVWAILICRIKQTGAASTDTVISVFSSTSIAAGLLILSRGGGFAKYSSLLIGDVLAVTPADLLWLLIALIVGVALWMQMYNSLLLTSVNESLARSRGVRTRLTECAFVVLVAVAVMLAIKWVGVMLINALLILPAAAGRNLARNSRQHALWSVLIALGSGVAGLLSAYAWDTSAGAAIVLYAAAFYAISLACRSLLKR